MEGDGRGRKSRTLRKKRDGESWPFPKMTGWVCFTFYEMLTLTYAPCGLGGVVE